MHPSYSVIFFTTASGAGYGLLILLCLFGALGLIPVEPWFMFTSFSVALSLISFGLISSMFHLGHPERAWRAFSQWQTSWLSREGIAAVVSFIPAVLLAIGWIFSVGDEHLWSFLAALTVLSALVTIYCTGMIYASLKTIRQWNLVLVPYVYLALGLATGAVLFQCLLILFGANSGWSLCVTLLLLAVALVLKHLYWHSIDNLGTKYTAEAATGLWRLFGPSGKIKPLDAPHSTPNFVMREMGFKIARKHALKLRRYSYLCLFVVPILMVCLALLGVTSLSVIGALIALGAISIGVILERWLFFAEAKHTANIFYGLDAV